MVGVQEPTKYGYVFAGWFDSGGYECKAGVTTCSAPNATATINAKWERAW